MVPQSRGYAIDFWRRYPEYLDRARDLGCNAFRFSISWTRVEPTPGIFDRDALKHYADLVEAIRQRAMEPVVTLCHYTWPMHVEQSGSLLAPCFPKRFADYVTQVRDALGSSVRYWLTFNEPDDLVTSFSRFNPRFPPGVPVWEAVADQVCDMQAVARNVYEAHRRAREILRAGDRGAERLVGMNSDVRGYPIGFQRLIDRLLTRHDLFSRCALEVFETIARVAHLFNKDVPNRPGWLDKHSGAVLALADGDWVELGALGLLPDLCPKECEDQLDFLAFDYYYAVKNFWQIGRLAASVGGHFERSPVYAPGLHDTLVYFDDLFRRKDPSRHKPIFIMENGLVDQKRALRLQGEPVRGAHDPATYIHDHVRQVQRAHAKGVNVIGYLVWSLTSNREWGLRLGPDNDFGLYGIDLDGDPGLADPSRPIQFHESAAVDVYREIIRQRGVG